MSYSYQYLLSLNLKLRKVLIHLKIEVKRLHVNTFLWALVLHFLKIILISSLQLESHFSAFNMFAYIVLLNIYEGNRASHIKAEEDLVDHPKVFWECSASGVLVNILLTNSIRRKKKSPMCSICQFPWCKYSQCG